VIRHRTLQSRVRVEPGHDRSRRFGLQARAIVAFAIGAALVSATLALVTFTLFRRNLLSQRTASVFHQTFVDARLVRVELRVPTAHVADALSLLRSTDGARSLIYRHGLWYSTAAASTGGAALPAALTRTVLDGHPSEETVLLGGSPTMIVGVPIPSIHVAYFEEHPLAEVQGTLNVLGSVLFGAAIATAIGGALGGWWVSRRLTRPLLNVVDVATDVAGGSLTRRLPDDPDLRPLITSFNAMVDALQRRAERDAHFASDVSHELRSPLTTIGASVELLSSSRDVLPHRGKQALDSLQFEVARFSILVSDLIDIAKMDATDADLHFADLPIDELVRVTSAAHHPSVPVQVTARAKHSRVHGDRRRLKRVFENLLENADTHAGGAVLVSVERDDGWVRVHVDDAGPGVPTAEREQVFERFYRGATSGRRRSSGGAGLGLALVAEHVRAHRGTVHIEERPTGGTRVTVCLPAKPT
jgi:two-component system, OmpR family, sensor histidine kinase MtrB